MHKPYNVTSEAPTNEPAPTPEVKTITTPVSVTEVKTNTTPASANVGHHTVISPRDAAVKPTTTLTAAVASHHSIVSPRDPLVKTTTTSTSSATGKHEIVSPRVVSPTSPPTSTSSEDGTGKAKYDQEARRRQQDEQKAEVINTSVGGVRTNTSVDEDSWDSEDEDPHVSNLKLKSLSDPNKAIKQQNTKFGPGVSGKTNKDYES